jgi:hypothetical protein
MVARAYAYIAFLGLTVAVTACETGDRGLAEDGADYPSLGDDEDGGLSSFDGAPSDNDSTTAKGPELGCSSEVQSLRLRPDSARDLARAAKAALDVERGMWPADGEIPTEAELYALLGPRVGPPGGRAVGRVTDDHLGVFYLADPAVVRPAVHVIAVLDLGISLRPEVPVLAEALRTIGASMAASGAADTLSVVEWTDVPSVPMARVGGAAAPAQLDAYVSRLREQSQLGGDPPLSIIGDAVAALAEDTSAHVVIFTDGTVPRTRDTIQTVTEWASGGAEITLVELQVYEAAAPALQPLPLHAELLGDRALAGAGLYVAAGVEGEATIPASRMVSPAHGWQIGYIFGDRFDDLFRPRRSTAYLHLDPPLTLGFKAEGEPGGAVGAQRWGTAGALFVHTPVEPNGCNAFEAPARVVEVTREDKDGTPTLERMIAFGPNGTGHHAVLDALDAAAGAMAARTCDVGDARAALDAATADGMGPEEASAFETSRSRVRALLDSIDTLCPPP